MGNLVAIQKQLIGRGANKFELFNLSNTPGTYDFRHFFSFNKGEDFVYFRARDFSKEVIKSWRVFLFARAFLQKRSNTVEMREDFNKERQLPENVLVCRKLKLLNCTNFRQIHHINSQLNLLTITLTALSQLAGA